MLLGVSTTNELMERDSKNYLHEWLKYHPDFCNLPGVQSAEDHLLDFVDIKKIFDQAQVMKPDNTQVLMALGILNFIERNYGKAAECF